MASGNGGQLAIAKLGSLYHDVNSAIIWQNFVSETVEHKLTELEEGSINGRRDAPDSHKGLSMADGEINMEPNPNAIGHWLKAWFGTHASSIVTNAASNGANSGDFAAYSQIWHKFTPTQAAFSTYTFLEPYNFLIHRDVGSSFLYKQGIVPQLRVNIEAAQLVKMSASIMARKTDRVERIAAIQSLVSSGGRPWVWDMASVEVSTTGTASAALAAQTEFEQLNMTFNLPHEGTPLLDGTKFYGEFSPTDFRRITFDGTLSFRDQDEYDAFIAYEPRRVRVTLLNVNSRFSLGNIASLDSAAFLGYPGMRFHFPKFKFLSWSAPISGPNRLTASFTAKAEYDEASGFSAAVELMNIVPAATYDNALS